MRRQVVANPAWVGTTQSFYLPLDDNADLFLKGLLAPTDTTRGQGDLTISGTSGQVQLTTSSANFQPLLAAIKAQLIINRDTLARDLAGRERVATGIERDIAALTRSLETAPASDRERLQGRLDGERRQLASNQNDITQMRQRLEQLGQRIASADTSETLDNTVASYFVKINGGLIKLAQVQASSATGEVLVAPTAATPPRPAPGRSCASPRPRPTAAFPIARSPSSWRSRSAARWSSGSPASSSSAARPARRSLPASGSPSSARS